MLTSTQIRQQYIDFFKEKCEHAFVASSPVVPHDDPTLLFTNAGMNQFKPYFLGTEQSPHQRVANTQKCIRAGGKHNDLDDVGKDTYHHTFFEMLGNWSFGDYFKKEAIAWAWELLVGEWGLDPNRLHATYFEGDPSEGLEPDLEAKALWKQYLPEERIHPGNKKDNFWEMGDTGPCGPCTEIHFDGTPDLTGGPLVNQDDPNVLEIWNLVFIQFNRNQDSSLSTLPAQHVDTGMGFERIVRVLQHKDSNYDTDVFTPIFEAIQQITGARAYTPGGHEEVLKDPINVAYRVIADHIRTLVFALSDGAHCGNDGRNYVLRSILRRAVRFGKQTLGVEEPFFYKLVPTVVKHFGEVFPEIITKQDEVMAELKDEEESFRRTLDRGIQMFDEAASGLAGDVFPGIDAFKLHDTYGFPIGLTQLMAEERGLSVDIDAFEEEMQRARERSRAGAGGVDIKAALTELVQQTDLPATTFTGYEQAEGEATVLASDALTDELHAVVLDQTPFYGEAGGQVGDVGSINESFNITDTQKIGDVYFHLGHGQAPAQGDVVKLSVDTSRRDKTVANHTTTHIMNRALRDQVNAETMQKGSLVDDTKTRFDFSHAKALTLDELQAVEKQVNDDIAKDLPVYWQYAPQEEALKINSLRAVFGEKYPPQVRVVSVGVPVDELLANPDNADWANYSIEFCGGIHLAKTGDAEGFVIISEEAVSKGIRRLTAITGQLAHQALAKGDLLLSRATALAQMDQPDAAQIEVLNKELSENTLPLVHRHQIKAQLDVVQKKQKQASKAAGKEAAAAAVEQARALADEHEGSTVIVAQINEADGSAIRSAMDVLTKRHPEAAILLFGAPPEGSDKVAMMAACPQAHINNGLKAGDWVKHVAPIVGGGGGGRPDKAQAGGKDPAKINEAITAGQAFAQTTV